MSLYIYRLINLDNGKSYLGHTKYKSILKYHLDRLEAGNHDNYRIIRDYKAGCKFTVEFICDCKESELIGLLFKYYEQYKPAYNIKRYIKPKVKKVEIDEYYTY